MWPHLCAWQTKGRGRAGERRAIRLAGALLPGVSDREFRLELSGEQALAGSRTGLVRPVQLSGELSLPMLPKEEAQRLGDEFAAAESEVPGGLVGLGQERVVDGHRSLHSSCYTRIPRFVAGQSL